MRTFFLIFSAGVLLFFMSACAPKQEPSKEPPYQTIATIKDIMEGMIEPSAEQLWDSVRTIVDAEGVHEYQPRTDEEWRRVRGWAMTLIEAPNLLMFPGRKVAKPGERSAAPGIELEPEEMEKILNEDRETFYKFARDLQDISMVALKAIDARDAAGLLDVGDDIDVACENCHLKYWYPNQAKAIDAQEKGLADPAKK